MSRMLRVAVAGGACLIAGSVLAADPPMMIEPPAPVTSAWNGVIEIGGLARYAVESDEGVVEDEDIVGGAYGSFSAWGGAGSALFGVDGYLELVSLEGVSATESLTPEFIGVLGAHVGTEVGDAYIGVFGALGVYPDDDNEEAVTGYAVGVEGTVDAGMATLFGRVGYAVAGSDEYDVDADDLEGMVGPFVEAGAVFAISDDLAVMASAGLGYSEDFDNTDDPGGYATWGAKMSYALPTDFALNFTAAYEGYYAYTEIDEDETIEHTVKVGLSVPFGDESAKASLDPLASSTGPFRGGFSSDAH